VPSRLQIGETHPDAAWAEPSHTITAAPMASTEMKIVTMTATPGKRDREQGEGDGRPEDRLGQPKRGTGQRGGFAADMPPMTWSRKNPSMTKTATPNRML
jgi:hypothetical protein